MENNLQQKEILQNFELFIESRLGIHQLRELVLSLAIRGKLSARTSKIPQVHLTCDFKSLRLQEDRIWGKEFLHDSPDHWSRLPLAKLGSWGSGGTPSSGNKEFYGGDIPWLTIGDLNDALVTVSSNSISLKGLQESSASRVPIGAVLVAMYGSIGKSGITGIECATNQAIAHCIPDTAIVSSSYLFYLIRALRPRLFAQGRGLAQQNISQTILKHLMVAVPPIDEQGLIVANIEELMRTCDQLEAAQNLRDRIEAAVRKSSASAISTAQTPEEFQTAWERIQGNWDVIAGGPESIESLRELVLDVLFRPRNRDEWVTRSFGELLSLSNGDRSKNYPSKEHRVSTGIPFVNAGHLNNGRVNMSDMDYITREKYESLGGGKFKDGDVLFCLRGSLGKSALVRDVGEGAIASSLAILRVGGELDAEYLFWFLQSGMARVQIKNFDNGTAQPNLAAKNVLKFKLPLPPLNQQRNIVSRVGELIEICDQLEASMIEAEDIAHRFARSVVLSSS